MRNLCVKVQMKTFYLDNYSKYSTFSLKIIFRLLRAKYTSRLNRKSKKKRYKYIYIDRNEVN